MLSNITAILQKAVLLAYLIPIIFFILFCISQSIIFSTIKKISFKKYFPRFSLITLLSFLLIALFLKITRNELFISQKLNPKIMVIFVLMFLIYYFTLILYLKLKDNFTEAIKTSFKTALYKFYILIPAALPLLFLLILYLFPVFLIVIFISSKVYLNIIYLIIFTLITITLILLYENFLVKLVEKY
jgi:hypothetical protein